MVIYAVLDFFYNCSYYISFKVLITTTLKKISSILELLITLIYRRLSRIQFELFSSSKLFVHAWLAFGALGSDAVATLKNDFGMH